MGNVDVSLKVRPSGLRLPRSLLIGTGGGGPPPAPFIADTDTYWFDFDYAGNVLDTLGHTTVAIVRERLRGEIEPWQPVKARQPLKVTGGMDCNQSTNRGLVIDFPKVTNGKNGWYVAGVVKPTTANVQVMSIARAASSAMSRMDMIISGSRNFGFRGVGADGSTPAYVIYTSPITLGQTYAFEFLWDFDVDTATAWLGGVQQTPALGPVGGPWSNFPASNPSDLRIGNTIANNLSFNGTMGQIIFRDGVPSTDQRASISAYNLTRVF